MPYAVNVSNDQSWTWYAYDRISENGAVVAENGLAINFQQGPFNLPEFIREHGLSADDTITVCIGNPDHWVNEHCRPIVMSVLKYAGDGVTILEDQTAEWIATQEEEDEENGLARLQYCEEHTEREFEDEDEKPVDYYFEALNEGTYCVGSDIENW